MKTITPARRAACRQLQAKLGRPRRIAEVEVDGMTDAEVAELLDAAKVKIRENLKDDASDAELTEPIDAATAPVRTDRAIQRLLDQAADRRREAEKPAAKEKPGGLPLSKSPKPKPNTKS